MRQSVTKQSRKEYLDELRPRYRAAGKLEQGRLLDEAMKVCHFHRKALIRILSRKPLPKAKWGLTKPPKNAVGRPREYHATAILTFIIRVWHATNQACGKRLKAILSLWLPKYEEATGTALSLEHQVLLLRMSPATIDRLLRDERRKYRVGKGRATTKPGTLLKHRIPIKTNQWNERRPGFLEIDTVGHCGGSTAGMYAFSLNSVDIASGWVEPRATWGKGETGVVDAFSDIEEALPFNVRGVDTDNGGEFLNHHLESYLKGRKRPLEQTRSREYKKNDNAHIEGRNWTHIRQYLGYARFDNPAVVPLMNDLYANEYSQLLNFFLPSVKLQEKVRIGSKITKRHDAPLTPCERLLRSPYISRDKKQWLREKRASLNPFILQQIIQKKIKRILQVASLRPQLLSTIPGRIIQTKDRAAADHAPPELHRATVMQSRRTATKAK
jgi:hypothetical protein